MNVLMICLGNICRSPLAEGILRHKAAAAGLNWQVDSAGTSAYHIGEPPHRLSQKVAMENGIDISPQRCRQFHPRDMGFYDRIYVMDHDNYRDVQQLSGSEWQPAKTVLLLNEPYPGQNRNVPDPWYGTEKNYHEVFAMLEEACDCIIRKYAVKNNHHTLQHSHE